MFKNLLFLESKKSVDIVPDLRCESQNIFVEILDYKLCGKMSGALEVSSALISSILSANRAYGSNFYISGTDRRHLETTLASIIYLLANFNPQPYDNQGHRLYLSYDEKQYYLDKDFQQHKNADTAVCWRNDFLTLSNVFEFCRLPFRTQLDCLHKMPELKPWNTTNDTLLFNGLVNRLIEYYSLIDDLFAPLMIDSVMSLFHHPFSCQLVLRKLNPIKREKEFTNRFDSKLACAEISFLNSMEEYYEHQGLTMPVYVYKEKTNVSDLLNDSNHTIGIISQFLLHPDEKKLEKQLSHYYNQE